MKIEEMPVYSLTKDVELYLSEMNNGVIDEKALELIMRLKMTDLILIENMYKVQAFNNLEVTYKRLGDELFTGRRLKQFKILFKETFNY